jgi:hypothetical protein
MLPRLEEAENAARMVKLFREDLEVSIGEITSSRTVHLEDPHLTIIDEGSSTFGPTWANLFELARKGRFSLIFGAQSTGGLTDAAMGLSEAFYERVMANVNLKVMMRIGDNRTAEDMAEWFGKVATTKKSIGAGITTGRTTSAMTGGFDFSGRRSGGESQSVNISEDEEYLVSAEELKHEMSAEKGLAWFDLGDGRIVKGRAFWFNAELPDTWEGREYLPKLERFEEDELGLGEWVDEQVLSKEQEETSPRFAPEKKTQITSPQNGVKPGALAGAAASTSDQGSAEQKPPEEDGAFKLGGGMVGPGGVARWRRGTVRTVEQPKTPEPEKKPDPEPKEEEGGWKVTSGKKVRATVIKAPKPKPSPKKENKKKQHHKKK